MTLTQYFPLVTLVCGAILGLLASIFLNSIKYRQSVLSELISRFLDAKKEIAETVTPLVVLNKRELLTEEQRDSYRAKVSQLFFVHYDVLPKSVLDALITLDVCLGCPEQGPYYVRSDDILPMPKASYEALVKRTTLYRNAVPFSLIRLSGTPEDRAKEAIRLHSRNVMREMNKYSSVDKMVEFLKQVEK